APAARRRAQPGHRRRAGLSPGPAHGSPLDRIARSGGPGQGRGLAHRAPALDAGVTSVTVLTASARPTGRGSGCAMDERPVDCAPHRPATWTMRRYREAALGQFDRQDRRQVAVVVTADGRRVHMPVEPSGLEDVSVLALLRSLLSLDG